MNVAFYRRMLFTCLQLAEWTTYTMIKDKLVVQSEKMACGRIQDKLDYWMKSLTKNQDKKGNSAANGDREEAGGFFFDILYSAQYVHPEDYENVKNEFTELINSYNGKRIEASAGNT